MLRLDIPFATTHRDPLDDIVEFPDIARPMMALQDRQRLRRDTAKPKPTFTARGGEESIEKIRNIFTPLA